MTKKARSGLNNVAMSFQLSKEISRQADELAEIVEEICLK